jgi:hypothetical protein
MRERTPIILSTVGFIKRRITVRVYIGLVPMLPKTRPKDFTMPLEDFRSSFVKKDSLLVAGFFIGIEV